MDPSKVTLPLVKKAANDFLKTYHPSCNIPVPIEEIVELKLEIRVTLIPGLIRLFGVNAFISATFDSIVIDENIYQKQPERTRFTMAEELGHLFLHKDWYASNGPEGSGDYLKWQENLDPVLFDYIERQAKTFAGMVLMPERVLLEEWERFADTHHLSTPCIAEQLPDTFPDLAQKFEVTTHSLLLRLGKEKLVVISDNFWRALGYSKKQ